jgi:hypothetical protein
MKHCPSCQQELPEISRYCTQCGTPLDGGTGARASDRAGVTREDLNINVLYGMVAALLLALIFPPWETPAAQAPEFLGFHFVLNPPAVDAVVSRLLLTIELTTVAIAGLYLSFLFRTKR